MKTTLLVLLLALTFGVKAQTSVSLYDIQYSAIDTPYAVPVSAYNGQVVKTGGIITGVCSYGYYMQTSHATKWAAINVYDKTYAPSLAVGDSVALTATVTEYYSETELNTVTSLTIISHNNQALTPPTVIALDSIQRREYQGMLIKILDATCVRFNTSAVWWVFSDSTQLNSATSEDTVDNILMTTQTYKPGQKYNITGCIHFEYANWIEPRDANDIEGVIDYQNTYTDMNVFPNPNQGVFMASVNASASNKNTEVSISDITGRVVYKEAVNIPSGKSSIPVDISSLGKGVYFLQISDSQSTAVKKVIIQ
jgi:hypothetical protein